jgi:hypothetical protein
MQSVQQRMAQKQKPRQYQFKTATSSSWMLDKNGFSYAKKISDPSYPDVDPNQIQTATASPLFPFNGHAANAHKENISASLSLPPQANLSPELWGPYAWLTLHYLSSVYAPNEPNDYRDKNKREKKVSFQLWIAMLYRFQPLIPCEKCSRNYVGELSEYPPESVSSTPQAQDVQTYIINLHNEVNKRGGQKIFSMSEAACVVETLATHQSCSLRYVWTTLVAVTIATIQATNVSQDSSGREADLRDGLLARFCDTLFAYCLFGTRSEKLQTIIWKTMQTSPILPTVEDLVDTQNGQTYTEKMMQTRYCKLLFKKLMSVASFFGVEVPSSSSSSSSSSSFSSSFSSSSNTNTNPTPNKALSSLPYELSTHYKQQLGGCQKGASSSSSASLSQVPSYLKDYYKYDPVTQLCPSSFSISPEKPLVNTTSAVTMLYRNAQKAVSHTQDQNHDSASASVSNEIKTESSQKIGDSSSMTETTQNRIATSDPNNYDESKESNQRRDSKQTDKDDFEEIEEVITPAEKDTLRQYQKMSTTELEERKRKKSEKLNNNYKKWYEQLWAYILFIVLAAGTVLFIRLLARNVDINKATTRFLPGPIKHPAQYKTKKSPEQEQKQGSNSKLEEESVRKPDQNLDNPRVVSEKEEYSSSSSPHPTSPTDENRKRTDGTGGGDATPFISYPEQGSGGRFAFSPSSLSPSRSDSRANSRRVYPRQHRRVSSGSLSSLTEHYPNEGDSMSLL